MTGWVALLTAVLLAGRVSGQAAGPSPLPPPGAPGGSAPVGLAAPSQASAGSDLPSAPEASPVLRPAPGQAAGPAPIQATAETPGQDLLQHARGLVQAGDFAAAEREVTALAAAQPGSADALFLLGYVQFREHKSADSLKSYTAGAAIRRPSPDDLLVVASDYVQLKDYADAARWLTVVTEEAPANATAWYLLGRAQYLQDHAAEALADFQRCLAVRPRDLRAKYNQGLALERLERPEEALAAYRTAVQWTEADGTRDPQPYLNLGTLLLTQGKTGESIATLQHAAELGLRNPMCFQQLGRALEAGGQNEKAVAAYRRAIDLAPGAERPHFFLGRLLRKLGRTVEADAEFAAVAHLYGGKSNTETPNPDSPQ